MYSCYIVSPASHFPVRVSGSVHMLHSAFSIWDHAERRVEECAHRLQSPKCCEAMARHLRLIRQCQVLESLLHIATYRWGKGFMASKIATWGFDAVQEVLPFLSGWWCANPFPITLHACTHQSVQRDPQSARQNLKGRTQGA